ncbi:MAG TPA: DNA ligase D [Nitrospira sp.]|nr:DNA ligase D [Nitrospira sp.]
MSTKRRKPGDPLERYRAKRDFTRTPEPKGSAGAERGARPIFVVQKHAASRLHYDLRLEMGGTLKSWAVPKGPSLDPSHKRLAVHVEDHPLDYADFEGVIPPDQYGAGTVLIWDRGHWKPVGNPEDGYRRGVLKFQLEGKKLRGGWTLVRMGRRDHGPRDSDKDNWLLIKERDAEARTGPSANIVERCPDSVQSGRDIGQVQSRNPRVWQSNRASETPHSASVPSARRLRRSADAEDGQKSSAARRSAPGRKPASRSSRGSSRPVAGTAVASLPGAAKRDVPDWIPPQLATLVDRVPSDEGWLHEIKYDGYRILCRVRRGNATMYTRRANDWTGKLRVQAEAVSALGLADAWLDGEMVVFTSEGRTDFQALQNAFDGRFTGRIVYCLFDLLYLDGYDLRATPLVDRKRLLSSLLAGTQSGDSLLRYSDHIAGRGTTVFKEACRRGLEGLIAKRPDSVYRSGRTRNWLKIKCGQRQEFVIGGFTDPEGSRRGFGALLVGYYQDGRLRYAGKVGTGFSNDTLRRLHRTLAKLEQPRPAFVDPPTGADARKAHWVAPELVAEVRFAEWTKEGILRQPSFQGLRTDKPAKEVVREQPRAVVTADDARHDRAAPKKEHRRNSRARLTNPERVLYPDLGLTKEGLARYYEQVADWILPHLRGRPLTLLRCPEGYQDCFFQKHANEGVPPSIGRVEIDEDGTPALYMVADTVDALFGLVQMSVLELHTWGATRDRLDRPDRLIFDLDPDPAVPWPLVIEAAQLTKALLEELGLVPFVKTTGGKGLHVVVPIQRTEGWEAVKNFAKAVADHMVAAIPQRFTSNMAKRARKGKIFIDYLRNARGATAIAAYSPRAKPGAPVSVPLAWEELSTEVTSERFTVVTLPDRLKGRRRDPWHGYAKAARRISARMKARLTSR